MDRLEDLTHDTLLAFARFYGLPHNNRSSPRSIRGHANRLYGAIEETLIRYFRADDGTIPAEVRNHIENVRRRQDEGTRGTRGGIRQRTPPRSPQPIRQRSPPRVRLGEPRQLEDLDRQDLLGFARFYGLPHNTRSTVRTIRNHAGVLAVPEDVQVMYFRNQADPRIPPRAEEVLQRHRARLGLIPMFYPGLPVVPPARRIRGLDDMDEADLRGFMLHFGLALPPRRRTTADAIRGIRDFRLHPLMEDEMVQDYLNARDHPFHPGIFPRQSPPRIRTPPRVPEPELVAPEPTVIDTVASRARVLQNLDRYRRNGYEEAAPLEAVGGRTIEPTMRDWVPRRGQNYTIVARDGQTIRLSSALVLYGLDKIFEVYKYMGLHGFEGDLLQFLNLYSLLRGTSFNFREPFLHIPEDRDYLSGLSEEELLDLLGDEYRGSHDKAFLLFTALTGKYATSDFPETTGNYQILENFELEQLQDPRLLHGVKYAFGPGFLRSYLKSTLKENLRGMEVEEQAVALLDYGFQFGGALDEAVISDYVNDWPIIGTRNPGTLPPPPIDATVTYKTLRAYTDAELFDAYELLRTNGRQNYINNIIARERGGSYWSIRHQHCQNDDTDNVVMYERHGDINKDDPQDPTLSYGVAGNYRCYQISELDASFRVVDDVFRFYVPDWDRADAAGQYFPETSIRQLKDLLGELRRTERNATARQQYETLRTKVKDGLEFAERQEEAIRLARPLPPFQVLRTEVDTFTAAEKEQISVYLSWLFISALFARYWTGPGAPYPYNFTDYGEGAEYCGRGNREPNFNIWGHLREPYLQTMSQRAQDVVLSLPSIDFRGVPRWINNPANPESKYLTFYVNRALNGRMCLGHYAQMVLITSYLAFKQILGYSEEQINQAIVRGFQELIRYYPAALDTLRAQLPGFPEDIRAKFNEAIPRHQTFMNAALLPIDIPRFNFTTGHTDPELWGGLQDVPEGTVLQIVHPVPVVRPASPRRPVPAPRPASPRRPAPMAPVVRAASPPRRVPSPPRPAPTRGRRVGRGGRR